MKTLTLKTNHNGTYSYDRYCSKHEMLIADEHGRDYFLTKERLTKYQLRKLNKSLKNNELQIVDGDYVNNILSARESSAIFENY